MGTFFCRVGYDSFYFSGIYGSANRFVPLDLNFETSKAFMHYTSTYGIITIIIMIHDIRIITLNVSFLLLDN